MTVTLGRPKLKTACVISLYYDVSRAQKVPDSKMRVLLGLSLLLDQSPLPRMETRL